MLRFILVFLFWATVAIADGHDFPKRFDVVGVASDDTLNIRREPTSKSPVMGELAHTATGIEVIRLNDAGTWGQINAGEGAGWVSLAYMAVSPGPHWSEMVEPLRCSGTEPFWDLAVTPRAVTQFGFFGEKTFTLTPEWESGAFGDPRTVLMRHRSEHGEVTTLVRAQACNDGMSDREFGLAIDLFLERPDQYQNSHYRGCCQLGIDWKR